MALVEFKSDATPRELMWFGVLLAAFLAGFGAFFYFRTEWVSLAYGLWITAGLLIPLYFAIPAIQKPIFLGWMYAAFPIGWVVSHVILGIAYYGVLTPVGLIMKIVGYDPMTRKKPDSESYWKKRRQHSDSKRYFRQF